MGLWPPLHLVNQRSLKPCRLELEDRPLDDASLFPLFDDQGRTRILMITTEEHARIMLADWAPGLFARDWPWRNRLRLRSTDLDGASVWDEERFDDLWHFDPWWVLGEERYQGHGALPALRGTNIPGYDSTMSEVIFTSDLGRVSHVVTGSGQSVKSRRFAADTLATIARRRATRARPRAVPPAAVGWRLRPFWRIT